MTTKRVPAKAKAAPAPKIVATMTIGGRTYKAKGATAADAIANIEMVANPKVRAILSVTDGKRTVEKILQPNVVMRLFSLSPLMREIQLKQLKTLCGL